MDTDSRRLTKRIESGVSHTQREGKWPGGSPEGFRRDNDGYLQLIHEPDRDAGEISDLEMRSTIERVDEGESYRAVAADTPNIGRSALQGIDKNEDRRAWYLDAEAADGRVDQVLANATD